MTAMRAMGRALVMGTVMTMSIIMATWGMTTMTMDMTAGMDTMADMTSEVATGMTTACSGNRRPGVWPLPWR